MRGLKACSTRPFDGGSPSPSLGLPNLPPFILQQMSLAYIRAFASDLYLQGDFVMCISVLPTVSGVRSS